MCSANSGRQATAVPTRRVRNHLAQAMERQEKYRKLNDFRNSIPYASQVALASICAKLKKGELDDICTDTKTIRAARDMNAYQVTPYGRLCVDVALVEKKGGAAQVPAASPIPYIYAVSKLQMFGKLVLDTFRRDPCSSGRPWELAIYADEAKPGNAIKQHNKRAMQCCYISFLNFGPAALCKEDYWLCVAAALSTDIAKCEAGMSQLVGHILKLCFGGSGHDLSLSGAALDLPNGQSIRLFARLSCVLGDESALHSLWQCKGSGGVRPCVQCFNIINKNALIAEALEPGSTAKDFTEVSSLGQCVLQTRARILHIVDELKDSRATMTKGKLKERETRLGWNDTKYNMLHGDRLRPMLDPTAQICFDWAHNILQGIWQVVVFHLLFELKGSGISAAHVFNWVEKCRWPKRISSSSVTGVDMFSPKRADSSWKAGYWKCSSGEALSMTPVLAHYCRTVVLPFGLHDGACLTFIALASLIQMLWYGPKLHVQAKDVSAATTAFFEKYVENIGVDGMLWKMHGILHHPQYICRWGFSPHTFPLERKHKHILKFGDDFDKDCKQVLNEVVSQSISRLDSSPWLDLDVGLVGARPSPKRVLAQQVDTFGPHVEHLSARRAKFNAFDSAAIGDTVAIKEACGWSVGVVMLFGSSAAIPYCTVQGFACVERHAWHSVWKKQGGPFLAALEDIVEVLIVRGPEHNLCVLHPLGLVG